MQEILFFGIAAVVGIYLLAHDEGAECAALVGFLWPIVAAMLCIIWIENFFNRRSGKR